MNNTEYIWGVYFGSTGQGCNTLVYLAWTKKDAVYSVKKSHPLAKYNKECDCWLSLLDNGLNEIHRIDKLNIGGIGV